MPFSFEEISLTNVRLSFPKLIEPSPSSATAKPTYGCDFIFLPNDPQFANFMEQVGACAIEKWKDKAQMVLNMIQNDRKLRCYGNGNEKVRVTTLQPHEGYVGNYFVSASSNADRPPRIARPSDGKLIDNSNTLERSQAAKALYGGCYVNAIIGLWAQDNQHGKAVRCNLYGIQFLKDGEPFGDSGPDITNAFKPVPGMQGQQQPQQGQQPGWTPQWPQQPQQAQQPQQQAPAPSFPPSWMGGSGS